MARIDPGSPAAALLDPASHAATLAVVAIDLLGIECMTWHPETIRLELLAETGVDTPKPNLERLYAAATLLTSDSFYKRLPTFCNVARVLSGGSVDPNFWTPPGALECAWAITESLLLAPPEDADAAPFDDDIRAYLGMVLDDEGFMDAPDVLAIALRSPEHAAARRSAAAHAATDPTVGDAAREMQRRRRGEMEATLRASLDLLVAQIEALKLENGDAAALSARLAGRHDEDPT